MTKKRAPYHAGTLPPPPAESRESVDTPWLPTSAEAAKHANVVAECTVCDHHSGVCTWRCWANP